MSEIKIELFDISKLKPNHRNPNKHEKDEIDAWVQIITYQGFRLPIVVSKQSGYMVAGHGRLMAVKQMGWKLVPTSFQDFLNEEGIWDEAKEYSFMVSDNAMSQRSSLDLSMINTDVMDLGPNFDIDLLGIPDFGIEPADKYAQDEEDEVPEVKEAITKAGDLWVLGEHRVLCGDCTDIANISYLMNSQQADMVFTDPPYNLAENCVIHAKNIRKNSFGKLKESKWDKDFKIDTLFPIIENLIEAGTVYICGSQFTATDAFKWLIGWADFKSYCVWEKTNPMPSLMKRHWTWSSELIFYGTKGKHFFNFPETGHAPSVWKFPSQTNDRQHPTQKPVAVPEHAITHSSKKGMLVWDGFLGSGSTLIACEKTGRKCYGLEIDPHYCDIIVKRWEDYTGKKGEKYAL